MIQFQKIEQQKKRYLFLLLLADEQESMIDRYLEQGTMYVMRKAETVIGVCVVLPISETELEVKNLAIAEEQQGNGYGRRFLEWIAEAVSRYSRVAHSWHR